MLAVVMLSLLVVGVITFLKPRKYLSVATALPASSLASDKSKIFNEIYKHFIPHLVTR